MCRSPIEAVTSFDIAGVVAEPDSNKVLFVVFVLHDTFLKLFSIPIMVNIEIIGIVVTRDRFFFLAKKIISVAPSLLNIHCEILT